jgi:hypothetical protein
MTLADGAARDDPTTMTDPKRVQQLMANAEKMGETGLARMCLRRLYELGGLDHDDPITRRLWQAVTACEETLRRKHGKSQRASYTRRKIADKGAIVTLSDWALDNKVTLASRLSSRQAWPNLRASTWLSSLPVVSNHK